MLILIYFVRRVTDSKFQWSFKTIIAYNRIASEDGRGLMGCSGYDEDAKNI